MICLMEVTILSLSYKPLWDMLEEKGISKMEFAKSVGISNATLAKLGKDEPISLTTVDKICNEYDCDIEDIVKHISTIKINDDISQKIDIGTIINTTSSLDRIPGYPIMNENIYFVITDKEPVSQLSFLKQSAYTYMVALLVPYRSKNNLNNLCIPISKVNLNNSEYNNLFLRLDTIRVLPSNVDFQIAGVLPSYAIDKIVKFNSFMKTLQE